MLNLLFGPRKRASGGDYWPESGGYRNRVRTQAGTVVDEDLALTYSAVWCATRAIVETCSMLPALTYRREPGENAEPAHDYYLYDLLKTCPNPTTDQPMGSMVFREGRTAHQVNWGNGFAEIEWDSFDPSRRTRVVNLHPIHPSRVKPVCGKDTDTRGRSLAEQGYRYKVRNNDNTSMALRSDEMLHIPGVLSEDGFWGKGVIAWARESIGFGLGTERHGASLFASGAMPRGIVYGTGMKDTSARQNFRREWKEVHGSPDSNEIAILPLDAKFQQVTISNEDSQFLGTRAFNIAEIARWYRVPPHIIMDLTRATFSNIESQSIEFIIYSILPWLRRWEEQINLKLVLPQDRGSIYVEHQLNSLLRGDIQTRMGAYQIAIMNGIMTHNEVRRLENLNSVGPEGDKLYIAANLQPIGGTALSEQKAPSVDPAAAAAGDSGAELLDVPDIRQKDNYDCGAACTQAVAQYFEVDEGRSEEDFIRELGTTPENGTEPDAIIDWFNDAGLVVTSGGGMTLDDLRDQTEDGRPVICPVQMYGRTEEYDAEEADNETGHYVVVIGVGLGLVFFQDPVAGRSMMDAAEFDRRWHDVEADQVVDDHFGIAVGESWSDDEDELDDNDEPEDPPVEPADDAESGGIRPHDPPAPAAATLQVPVEAVRATVGDALARGFTKIAHAIHRERSQVTDLDAWLTAFELKHYDALTANLQPAAQVLAARSGGEGLLVFLMGRARVDLGAAFDSLTRAQLDTFLGEWPRAAAATLAEQLIKEKSR